MATPVFACGAECGMTPHWTLTNTPTVITSGQRSGLRAVEFVKASGIAHVLTSVATFGAAGILVLRGSVYLTVYPDLVCNIFGASFSSVFAGVRISSVGAARTVCSAGLGTPGDILALNRWYDIDILVNTSANPWTCDAKVDGVSLGQATSATAADTTAKAVQVGLITAAPVVGTLRADDILASVTLADYPLSAGAVFGYVPVSDGTHNIAGASDFQRGDTGVDLLNATLSAYQLIDDVPLPTGAVDQPDCWRATAPPNSTDYPEAIFGPISGTPHGTPLTVEAICAHHQIATTNGSYEVLLNDNGTTSVISSAAGAAGVTTYRYGRAHFATAPTGGAWTAVSGAGNFNNVRVRFRSADALPDQCLDGIVLEAYFATIPAMSVNNKTPGRHAPFKPGEVTRVKH